MSDPCGRVVGMTETCVSASHFRVHLKDIANSVKRGEQKLRVERHGCQMFAVVSIEDLEFLLKHKYSAEPATEENGAPEPEMINLVDPELMPLELVEEAYGLSAGSSDPDIIDWRTKAYFSIKLRTGKSPEPPPW
jgi:hypothetical protein